MKKLFVVLFAVILSVSLLCTSMTAMTFADGENVIKLVIDVPTEYQVGGSLAGNTLKFGKKLSPDAGLGINVWPDSVLSYEVYSPTPVAGLGNLDIQFSAPTWKMLSAYGTTSGTVDQNGDSVKEGTDISAKISNGWHLRQVALPSEEECNEAADIWHTVYHVFMQGSITVPGGIPYSQLVVYYKNIKVIRPNAPESWENESKIVSAFP